MSFANRQFRDFSFFIHFSLLISYGVTFSQCTEEKDQEMAKYMNLTKTRDAQGCSQCGILALYFCSAKYASSLDDKTKISSMIDVAKSNIRQLGEPYCCPEYLSKQPEWGTASKSAPARGNELMPYQSSDNTAAKTSALITSVLDINSASEASEQASSVMVSNSFLSRELKTKEEIEAAFERQSMNINNSAAQRMQSENARTDALLKSGVTGIKNENVLSAVASGVDYINRLEAEAARKKTIEMLEFQKVMAIQRLETAEKQKELEEYLNASANSNTSVGNSKIVYNPAEYALGQPLDLVKKQYKAFFKKAQKPVVSQQGQLITSKAKDMRAGDPWGFYVKNNVVSGSKFIVARHLMDMNFEACFNVTSKKIAELESLLGARPTLSTSEEKTTGKVTKKYTWITDQTVVELESTQMNSFMIFYSEVLLGVFMK
jgi:hypothetical protein